MSGFDNSLDVILSLEVKSSFQREMHSETHSALRKDLALAYLYCLGLSKIQIF